jgi:hypothetical protein
MNTWQAFFLGVMTVWTPSMILLAWMLRHTHRIKRKAFSNNQPTTPSHTIEAATPKPITTAGHVLAIRAASDGFRSLDIGRSPTADEVRRRLPLPPITTPVRPGSEFAAGPLPTQAP